MPNTDGTNQYRRFTAEPPQGAKKQLDTLSRSAVMAGKQGATSAIETPRRSKKRAVRGQAGLGQPLQPAGTEPVAPPQATPAPEGIVTPEAQAVAWWAQVAMIPGISPVAQQIANEGIGVRDAA